MTAAGNVGSNRNHSTELPGTGYLVLKLDTCLIVFHLLLPNPGHRRGLWTDDYLSSPLRWVTERHGSNLTSSWLLLWTRPEVLQEQNTSQWPA